MCLCAMRQAGIQHSTPFPGISESLWPLAKGKRVGDSQDVPFMSGQLQVGELRERLPC